MGVEQEQQAQGVPDGHTTGGGVLVGLREALTGLTAFGVPVEHGGVVILPASRVFGGGGGGEGSRGTADGEGGGLGGFGGFAVPAGAFVINADGAVTWRPAHDLVARAAVGAAVVALVLGWRALSRKR